MRLVARLSCAAEHSDRESRAVHVRRSTTAIHLSGVGNAPGYQAALLRRSKLFWLVSQMNSHIGMKISTCNLDAIPRDEAEMDCGMRYVASD